MRFGRPTDYAAELLVSKGQLTRRGPSARQWKDIRFGWKLAKEMGRLDVGQSVAVKDQAALAIEAVEGTDECIRRAGVLCCAGGFSVVKVAKPQQDMRYDVPTVGMQDHRKHRLLRRRRAGHRGRPNDSSGRTRGNRLRRPPRLGDRGHRRCHGGVTTHAARKPSPSTEKWRTEKRKHGRKCREPRNTRNARKRDREHQLALMNTNRTKFSFSPLPRSRPIGCRSARCA